MTVVYQQERQGWRVEARWVLWANHHWLAAGQAVELREVDWLVAAAKSLPMGILPAGLLFPAEVAELAELAELAALRFAQKREL